MLPCKQGASELNSSHSWDQRNVKILSFKKNVAEQDFFSIRYFSRFVWTWPKLKKRRVNSKTSYAQNKSKQKDGKKQNKLKMWKGWSTTKLNSYAQTLQTGPNKRIEKTMKNCLFLIHIFRYPRLICVWNLTALSSFLFY